jgi:hypothetical protein
MNTKVCTALFVCLAAFIVKSSASNHTSVNNTIQPTPRQVVVSTSQVTTNKNNGTMNATVILPSASVGPTTQANATTTTGAATTFKSSLPWFVACSLFVARFM